MPFRLRFGHVLARCVFSITASLGGALALVAGTAQPAHADVETFPGFNSFVFEGHSEASGGAASPSHRMSVCAVGGSCLLGTATPVSPASVIANEVRFLSNGAVVRGSAVSVDPFDTSPYHVMQLELDTNDFFAKNDAAHMVIAARAYMPFSLGLNNPMVNGYPEFTPGTPEVPYAMGSGIILGTVPCDHDEPSDARPFAYPGLVDVRGEHPRAIAVEHFLRPLNSPFGPSNKTWCHSTAATPPAILKDNTTYHISIAVRRAGCAQGTCSTVGYFIEEKVCSGFGCTWVPVARGGGSNRFPDTSAASVPSAGWSRLVTADRSSWFLATIFTRPFDPVTAASSWSFKIRSLVVEPMTTAPSWWTTCLDAASPPLSVCGPQ